MTEPRKPAAARPSRAKNPPAPKAVTSGEPGPKPEYQVVESNLHAKTFDGEVVLSLLIPYKKIKRLLSMGDIPQEDAIDFVLDEIMAPSDAEKVYGLSDGAETMKVALGYLQAVGERMGMSLEKFGGSSAS